MIKGKGTNNGRVTLIFGLSFENLKRLKQDKPIVIHREEMGINYDIVIFAGKDEATMAKMVSNPNTIITGSMEAPTKN